MSRLPAGTVTFLFTDIEGSTRLLQDLGDQYAGLLADHHRLLRSLCGAFDGVEVQDHGDGLYYRFPSARAAVQSAVAAQRALLEHCWPSDTSVRVRMGLHTGEPMVGETGLVGIDVHRAARICAAGWGGQILLSQTTRDLVADDLPDGAGLRDLGEHRLKDLTRAERLFQVVAAELPDDFPPLRSLSVLPNNLPHQWTSFVGREREMAEIRPLIEAHRLVTLTGIGGCGKTRLALQVGADLLPAFPDGVWLVEFAALTDTALVPSTVASVMKVTEDPRRPILDTLTDALDDRPLLLILDNCEHLLAACADLARALLARCARVRILSTSREALGLPGEATYQVPSLSVPELPEGDTVDEVGQLIESEAVRLFVDRASAASADFALSPQTAATVATICHRLDGIPLAIELAAPRVKAMTVARLSERLHDRFRLLTGARHSVLPRHQTLQAAMDWSYQLLADPERAVLRRLSVFAGGFTLDAAEAVCAGDGVESADVLDLLTHLVEKSLVAFDEKQSRYRLLETVRQYGRSRLIEAGEVEAARTRHRDFYLALAEEADTHYRSRESAVWLNLVGAEHDNLRAALEWSLERADGEMTLRLAAALGYFWHTRTLWSEGHEWLEKALAGTGAPAAVRARALFGSALIGQNLGHNLIATRRFAESIALSRQAGDRTTEMYAFSAQVWLRFGEGDADGAAACATQALTIAREIGDRGGESAALNMLGMAASRQDTGRAYHLLEESLALGREQGEPKRLGFILYILGQVATVKGDYRRAEESFRESLEHARILDFTAMLCVNLRCLGEIATIRGDYTQARSLLEQGLGLHRRAGERFWRVNTLNGLGWLLLCEGDNDRATALLEEALAIAQPMAQRESHTASLRLLGIGAGLRGANERAVALLEESVREARVIQSPLAIAGSLVPLARLARKRGELATAFDLLLESLRLAHRFEHRLGIATCLEALAGVTVQGGRSQRAARLFGMAEALRQAIGAVIPPFERADHDRDHAAARAALGNAAFDAAWAEGLTMTLEDAVSCALRDDLRESRE